MHHYPSLLKLTTVNLNIRAPLATSSPVSNFAPGAKIDIVWPKETSIASGTRFVKVYYNMNQIGWVAEEFIFPDYPIEFVPPTIVTGTYNGSPKNLYPKSDWGLVGGGTYRLPLKDNRGRYNVAVGPKLLRPDYPDSGKVLDDDFNGFNKDITVVLEHIRTGERLILPCVVVDNKAHSFNKYPTNIGSTASFNIESGYVQTGIRYPNATNDSPFSPGNMEGTVIEFATTQNTDFTIGNYSLVKVIVPRQ